MEGTIEEDPESGCIDCSVEQKLKERGEGGRGGEVEAEEEVRDDEVTELEELLRDQ